MWIFLWPVNKTSSNGTPMKPKNKNFKKFHFEIVQKHTISIKNLSKKNYHKFQNFEFHLNLRNVIKMNDDKRIEKIYFKRDIRYTHVCFTYLYSMSDQVSFRPST